MRAGLLLLVACSSAVTSVTTSPAPSPVVSHAPPPSPIAADVLARAVHARWLGAADPAALRDAADVDGLAELGRAELAANHAAAADRAFAAAVTRAERDGRGHWVWPRSFLTRVGHFQFTPDGRWLVSGDAEGRVDIWDVASMHVVRSFATSGYARSFAVSHDGKWLATCLETTQIWDLETGAVIAQLPFDNTVTWSSRDHLIATRDVGFADYDVATKKTITVDGDKLRRIVAANGKLFAVGELYTTIYDDEQLVRTGTLKFSRPIENIARIGDDAYVSTTDQGLIWHDLAGHVRHEVAGRWYTLAASTDLVATTTYQGTLELYRDGKLVHTLSAAGRNSDEIAFHPRGAILAAAGHEGANLWNAATGKHIMSLVDTTPSAASLAFDASGERLAVGSGRGHVAVWSLATGTVETLTVRPTDYVEHLAFAPDGSLATSSAQANPVGRAQSTLVVFDRNGKRLWWRDHERTSYLGYRPGTQTLATVQLVTRNTGYLANGLVLWKPDGTIERTIDVDANRAFEWRDTNTFLGSTTSALLSIPLDGAPASSFALRYYHGAMHPGGRLLASAIDDGKIAIWDVARAQPTSVVFEDVGGTQTLAWTPDGKTLVTAGSDTVSLWDHTTGARFARLVGPTQIHAVAIRPDGRVIAVGYRDGRVILWSIATGTQIATLQSTGELSAFVVTPDGAIDGTPDDALAWRAGTHVLPARSVFSRQRVPNLLATRMAQLPHDDVPRAHLAGSAPPPPLPRCMPEAEPNQRRVRSAHVTDDGKHVHVCVDHWNYTRNRILLRRPAMCFDVDLATGKYEPTKATVAEALGEEPPARTASLVNDDSTARICERGVCRDIAIKALEARISVHAGENYLAAAYELPDTGRAAVLVYEIATGRRLSQLISEADATYTFLDDTLLAGSSLIDIHTGRAVASVKLHDTSASPTKVAGSVWAFADATGAVVLQNVKTGRVAGRLTLPPRACTADGNANCRELTMLAAGPNLIVLPVVRPGDVMVVDQKGKLLADHHLPVCQ